jgi:hypothetical protein
MSMRVLIAFEDTRSIYGDAIVRALHTLRPTLEVYPVSLSDLEYELGSFDPHVVICSQPNGVHPGSRGAWVEVPTEDTKDDDKQLAEICLEGEQWNTDGPPLREILEVIDETQKRLREGRLTEAC